MRDHDRPKIEEASLQKRTSCLCKLWLMYFICVKNGGSKDKMGQK